MRYPNDAPRSALWNQVTLHWAGFSADLRSLESGGWIIATGYDLLTCTEVLEARHRVMNIAFRQRIDDRTWNERRDLQLPLDFSSVLQPKPDTVPDLLDRILKIQEKRP